ncbi:MAG: protein kinase, partial [Planctomycetales bacterium]|nr:protein kinase [Planctomycetales bacterium]
MQLTSIEIWQRIERMGIASAEQCRGWAAEAAQRIKNGDSSDGAQLIRALVELGLLSQFQSQVLVGETEVRLRYAKWLVQRPLEDPIWKFWSEFRAGEGHAVQQSEFHWGRWISASQLDQLRSSGPALARVRALSAVRHPHLQSVLEPEWCDHELGLFVSPLAGKALTRRPSASSFSVRQSVEVIVQIAGALAELHARHVVHGRVLPDRVYYDGTQAVLACDPLCLLTASADPSAQGLLASDLGRFCYAQFIAPEYLAPGQQASAASDVYSLGCLWWWMLCGVPSNPGTTLASAMAAHAHPVPSLPSNVDISEDLKACLSYMLAKNADARFSDAIELQTALRAALKPPVDVQPDVDQARPTALEKVPASTVVKAVPVEEVLAPATATPVPAKVIVAKPVSSARSADNDLVKVVDRGSKVVEAARLEPGAGKIATRLTSGRRSPAKSPAARRRPSNTWLLATIASCTLLIVVLLALNFSGVLQPPSEESIREDPVAAYQPRAAAPAP